MSTVFFFLDIWLGDLTKTETKDRLLIWLMIIWSPFGLDNAILYAKNTWCLHNREHMENFDNVDGASPGCVYRHLVLPCPNTSSNISWKICWTHLSSCDAPSSFQDKQSNHPRIHSPCSCLEIAREERWTGLQAHLAGREIESLEGRGCIHTRRGHRNVLCSSQRYGTVLGTVIDASYAMTPRIVGVAS